MPLGYTACWRAMTGSSHGVALIAVLWVTSLLALMAAGIGSTGRTAIRLAYNGAENAKARSLADAGAQRAIYDLMTSDSAEPWPGEGRLDRVLEFGNGRAYVQVRDEDGKIDLNMAPPEMLQGLFRAVGVGEHEASILAARVLDFRDVDSDPTPGGAEDEAYLVAGRAAGAADRPFRRIQELVDVLGVTSQIYDRVRPHVTIYADVERVDLLRASKTVMRALPGMTPEAEAAILSNTGAADPLLDLPETLIAAFENYILPSRDLIFEIRSLGESDAGGRFLREAVVALDGGQGALPFTLYAWQRNETPLEDNATPVDRP